MTAHTKSAPKWPINSKKHTELARQAAMMMCYFKGVEWTGSPTNAWLAEQIGESCIYAWWNREGRALCARSKDERIFDEARW